MAATSEQAAAKALEVLRRFWGYNAFREPQAAVISNALAGSDALVVMATGGGKSICYQVPPLVTGEMCIVVSPLIALMEDQVAALSARGIKAAMLGSAQSKAEVTRAAWQGAYDLVYITPELATNSRAALQALHATRRIGLLAIDEAHTLSEWGHDFRPAYRQLGELRDALPDVPCMALTATATHRVQQDIISQLRMGQHSRQPGGRGYRQWVMSFERPRLHLAVQMRAAGGASANMAQLVSEAAAGAQPSTLVYAQTTNEVDSLTAYLQAKGVKTVKYHAKLPVAERTAAHKAFLRDDAWVMVASVAFGMGIDKPNIRRIIHYGVPASLEAYYQQAGRAGRDGAQAHCLLLWSPQDFVVQDMIKGASTLTGWSLESHRRGMEALRGYTSGGGCRHAALVNFFQPGSLHENGPCQGGCDNCSRRRAVAPGQEVGTDVGQHARLLVAAVKGLKSYGLSRAVALLRGSKAKSVEHWMQQLTGPDGKPLHGAGTSRSEEWWKGLAGVLMSQGLLTSETKPAAKGGSFNVTVATPKGCQWLAAAAPQPLTLLLPSHMEAEDTRLKQREAAEAQRAAERHAAQQRRDTEAEEKAALLAALRQARKTVADSLGQAPDVLVNDPALQLLVELRPSSLQELDSVSGFGQSAIQHFGQPLLQVIKDVCAASSLLSHNTDWHTVRRMRSSAQAGQQQQFQQHWQQYAHASQQPGGAAAGAGGTWQQPLQAGPWIQGGGGSGGSRPSPAAEASASAPGSGPPLQADPGIYQVLLDSKVLGEPKAAARAAWDQWELGHSMPQIASHGRDKPIEVSTVQGYLAEAAAHFGCSLQRAQQLQAAAGLGGSAAADMLLWRIAAAISANRGAGLLHLKKTVLAEVDAGYGQIKMAAALMALHAIPGAGGGSSAAAPCMPPDQPPQQQQPHQQAVQWGAEVQRLLQQPASLARELFGMWQEGVPLGVLGQMHGSNITTPMVLGHLADMAASGFPTDMQQLAGAALLEQAAAEAVAAAIRQHGHLGMHAVQQALQQQQLGGLSTGQIKVVAALLVTQSLWFADAAAAAAAQAPDAAPAPAFAAASAPMEEHQGPSSSQLEAEDVDVVPDNSEGAAAAIDAAGMPGDDGGHAAAGTSSQPALSQPKRRLPSALLSNKTGKRRRPTCIAAPKQPDAAAGVSPDTSRRDATAAAAGAGAGAGVACPQAPCLPHTPAPAADGGGSAATPPAGALTTPQPSLSITPDAVMQLLWGGTCTGPDMLKALGGSTPEHAQTLARVLEQLIAEGDQVMQTPQRAKVDVTDATVRFVAF